MPACAAPVHISLKANAGVGTDASGFVTLAQVAELTGGDRAGRIRMGNAAVGRVPLPGDTRRVTAGDIRLKLRQAGFHPETDAVLEGAPQVVVTAASVPDAPPPSAAATEAAHLTAAVTPAIHRGDSVAIVVQDSGMTITTKGVAREAGAVGQSIRVHREGVMTDLSATIIDAQTVQVEN